jgi:hypothetical protein
MKANELRIGNYLDYYGQNVIVLELLKNDNAEFGYFNNSIVFNRKLTEKHSPKPIKLTKEWLIKFGFEKDGVLIDYAVCLSNEKILGVDLKNKRAHCYHIIPSVQGANLCSLEYVHQLQNLYFALTNKELKL